MCPAGRQADDCNRSYIEEYGENRDRHYSQRDAELIECVQPETYPMDAVSCWIG